MEIREISVQPSKKFAYFMVDQMQSKKKLAQFKLKQGWLRRLVLFLTESPVIEESNNRREIR